MNHVRPTKSPSIAPSMGSVRICARPFKKIPKKQNPIRARPLLYHPYNFTMRLSIAIRMHPKLLTLDWLWAGSGPALGWLWAGSGPDPDCFSLIGSLVCAGLSDRIFDTICLTGVLQMQRSASCFRRCPSWELLFIDL